MRSRPAETRLDSLTGLRFFAALVVFAVHLEGIFYFRSPYLAAGRAFIQGSTGVSFFFVLSGFVLTWSHRSDDTTAAFVRRRLARIGPLHVVTWGLMGVILVALVARPSAGPAAASLALLTPWVPSFSGHLPMNVPSWSLGCELFFYLLFPFVYPRLRAASPRQRWLVVTTGLASVAVLAAVCAPAAQGSTRLWLLYYFPPTRLIEFVIGIVLALEVLGGRLPRIPLSVAGLLAVGAYGASGWVPDSWRQVAVTLVPFAVLIVAAAQADVAGSPSILRSRAVVTLGVWSFAFYLVHWPVLVVAAHLDNQVLGVRGALAVGLGSLLVTIAASGLLHRLVERPLEARLRGAPVRPDDFVDATDAVSAAVSLARPRRPARRSAAGGAVPGVVAPVSAPWVPPPAPAARPPR